MSKGEGASPPLFQWQFYNYWRLEATMKNQPNENEPIGQTVRNVRLRLNLTINEMGELLGKSGNTIARWERGEVQPDSPIILKLALESLVLRHLSEQNPEIIEQIMHVNPDFQAALADARKRASGREDLEQLQREVVKL
jgi:transcriptional regulator with XRE-family HTH domain